MNKKVLIINDYFKQHYIGYSNGKPINVFKRTNDGVYLSGMLKLALKTKGYDDNVDWEAAFAYPAIPNVIKENKRNPELTIYQPPLPEQVKEKNGELFAKIREVDPDMIVVAGSIAAKAVTGVGTLSRLRSKETVIDILGKEYPLTATYSPGYVLGNPNSKELATLDFEMVAAYLKDGKNSLKKKEVDYTILTNKDVDKILSVISLVKTVATSPEKAVALDYETNTLSGTAEESKILSVSLSFSENTGVTFPIDHPDSPLSVDDKAKVIAALMDVYASEAYLVLHNASFDLAQTKTIFGPVEFKHTMDTLVAFFMLVSQDDSVPKNLKHLAVQYTDMGEYDSELDDFKSWFSLGFTGTRAKKLKDIYLKPFTYKVQEQLEGKYQLEDSDFLPYMTDDDRKNSLATATRLLERFGTYNKICNEFDEDDNFSYAWIPYPIMAKYACGDVDATKRIHKRFIKQMADNDEFYNLYTSHYPELINVTTNLQALGATIDIPYLEKTAQVFDEELDRLYAEMLELPEVKKTVQYKESLFKLGMEEKKKAPADRDKEKYKYYTAYRKEGALEFNPRSKLDLHYALFSDKANWPSIDSNFVTDSFMKKLRNNQVLEEDITYLDFKTDKETLDEVLRKNPDSKFAQYFKTYGRLNKLNSTYTRALINRADSEGQLHGSYSVTTAATTRLSSKNPNMQNISKPTNDPSAFDYDYPIKNAFIPNFKKGQDTIINLDFSSQEAHLAAVIADDESMIESFMEGKDVHSETAALMYNIPVSEVTKDQRQAAKSTTFGLFYGKTPVGYANDMGITKEEAEEIFEKYFEGKPKIKDAIERAHQEVKNTGGIRIPASGFVRKLGDIKSNQYAKQQKSLREAFNTIIQGSSAMLTQLALIKINEFLPKSGLNADVIMTVHDSITLSSAREDVDKAVQTCRYIMEHIPLPMLFINYKGKDILFPMKAGADVGATYGYEFEYDKEDFYSFASTKGFTEYYKAVKKIDDLEEHGMINKEEQESLKAKLELRKPEFQHII